MPRKEVIFVFQKRYIRTLSHCYYDCKYHIVWTPKFRGKIFTKDYIKKEMDRIIRTVCRWKGFEIIDLSVQTDHVHLTIIISPKYSISYAMSIIKGKSSAWVKKKNHRVDRKSVV